MSQQVNSTPKLVRVSVLFSPPPGLRNAGETPASRYKRITTDTNSKRQGFLGWLEEHHIFYSHVTMADAFGTIFLNVPCDAVAKLKSAPDVVEVDEEMPVPFEPLANSDHF